MAYHKLSMEATKARDQLNDYLVAKVIERQNLIEDITRRKNDIENERKAREMQDKEDSKGKNVNLIGLQQQSKPTQAPQQSHQNQSYQNQGHQNQSHQQQSYQQPSHQQQGGYPNPNIDNSWGAGLGLGFGQQGMSMPGSNFFGNSAGLQFGNVNPQRFAQPAPPNPIHHWGNTPAGGNNCNNPYMNPVYPPWYNSQKPGNGPWG